MFVWEWKLKVRRAACEFRLVNLRERHSELTEQRSRSPENGDSWKKKSDKMALLRNLMYRELDEIVHIKRLAMVGPIKGGSVVLHIRDGKTHKVRPGPSIIDLINREADSHFDSGLVERAEGLRLALEIMTNPYNFLDSDEQASYDAAESQAKRMTGQAGVTTATRDDRPGAASTAPSVASLKASGAQMIRRGNK